MRERLLQWAEITDAFRVFPRLFLIGYGLLGLRVCAWVMTLDSLSVEQMGFASVVAGLFVPLTGWYMQTGRKWQ